MPREKAIGTLKSCTEIFCFAFFFIFIPVLLKNDAKKNMRKQKNVWSTDVLSLLEKKVFCPNCDFFPNFCLEVCQNSYYQLHNFLSVQDKRLVVPAFFQYFHAELYAKIGGADITSKQQMSSACKWWKVVFSSKFCKVLGFVREMTPN